MSSWKTLPPPVERGDLGVELSFSPAEFAQIPLAASLQSRMSCRRSTRLTNAFSKKVENHAWAVALHMKFYNFGRIHKTLRVTPAIAAGVNDHAWTLAEIAGLIP
jgi:hypothetical protein